MGRILIIEDSKDSADMLTDFFWEHNIVRQANSYETAKEKIFHEKFDIVLCDYYLDESNGIDILRDFKDQLAGSKKILMSAFPTIKMLSDAHELGVSQFLRKPFSIENFNELAEIINNNRCTRFELGGKIFIIDNDLLEISYDGGTYSLSEIQVIILKILFERRGLTLTREEYSTISKSENAKSDNRLDIQISQIKNKVPIMKELIESVRGEGFKIRNQLYRNFCLYFLMGYVVF